MTESLPLVDAATEFWLSDIYCILPIRPNGGRSARRAFETLSRAAKPPHQHGRYFRQAQRCPREAFYRSGMLCR
jgi:hypothetical protein